jgi:hypothetical protein
MMFSEKVLSDSPSLKIRILILTLSSALTAGLAEGLIRMVDGNALPMIRLFQTDSQGHIQLMPSAMARIASPRGLPWEIHTDEAGRRVAPKPLPDTAWVVVGDSQVMGNGVADNQPFPALLNLDGEPAHNLGVPGYGVGDALWMATQHLDKHDAGGVIVVVNQMNDWEETEAPVGERYQVRGGWLIDTEDADGARGSFLASPLAWTHIGFLLGHLVLRDWSPAAEPIPDWMSDPPGQRTKTLRIASAIQAFARTHPNTRVLPVYLPADVYASEGRAAATPLAPHLTSLEGHPWEDTRLRDQVMITLADLDPVDLTPALTDHTAFLEGDYHLSPEGHQAVANAIMASLQKPVPPTKAIGSTAEEIPPQ